MPVHKSITLQVHNARDRQRSIISNAIKEIKHDRESGQPDVPGLNQPQDDFGSLVGGCPSGPCPEQQFVLDLLSLNSGDQIVDYMNLNGGNYETPVRSSSLTDVWFDDLPAVEGEHYQKVDESTITPTVPLAPDTQVKSRFLKY